MVYFACFDLKQQFTTTTPIILFHFLLAMKNVKDFNNFGKLCEKVLLNCKILSLGSTFMFTYFHLYQWENNELTNIKKGIAKN